MSALQLIETALGGYRAASSAERAGFGLSLGFSGAIGVSRVLNYVRERRRAAPRVRSWVRRLYHSPGRERLRVHHFLPGLAVAFLAGGAAILTRPDGHELRLSVPFGVGVGLTLDEIAILGELDNPYWGSQDLALIQSAAAGLLAGGLGIRFLQRALAGLDPATAGSSAESERRHGETARGNDRTESGLIRP